jgi:hypothetical protein
VATAAEQGAVSRETGLEKQAFAQRHLVHSGRIVNWRGRLPR